MGAKYIPLKIRGCHGTHGTHANAPSGKKYARENWRQILRKGARSLQEHMLWGIKCIVEEHIYGQL